MTFPARAADAPAAGDRAHYPGTDGRVVYAEDVFVGYRHYDSGNLAPAFPFGYGLSYTTFRLSNLKATRTAVTATVTNTGKRRGYAVPQLYLGLPGTRNAPQPPKQLKGFPNWHWPRPVGLGDLSPDSQSFSYWDQTTSSWRQAPGCAKAMVGTSSRTIALTGTIC